MCWLFQQLVGRGKCESRDFLQIGISNSIVAKYAEISLFSTSLLSMLQSSSSAVSVCAISLIFFILEFKAPVNNKYDSFRLKV